ncbi:MAG: hypothetical protein ACREFN_07790, partial [Acetobacteraceae bacterium]
MIGRMLIRTALLLVLVAGGASVAHGARTAGAAVQYHADAVRSGRYVVPGLTPATVSAMRPAPVLRARVTGPVYAAPLYARTAGSSAMLILATEQNAVEALDPANGKTIWRTALGPPVPRSGLPCGDIEPLGITGTPVIDRGVVYV